MWAAEIKLSPPSRRNGRVAALSAAAQGYTEPMHRAANAVFAFFSGVLAAVSMALPARAIEQFDRTSPGALPPAWAAQQAGPGHPVWGVAADPAAPSPPQVLLQSGWSPNPSFPLCVLTNARVKDGFVQARFKPMIGTNDQAAGVVWRFQDPANYYVARANALENNVVLYKVHNGKRTALDIVGRAGGYGVKADVPRHQWSVLRVEFEGPRSRVLLNGRELFAVEDATFSDAGTVGVWTKADSVTAFDDFEFASLP
jgi:hypothetical protein